VITLRQANAGDLDRVSELLNDARLPLEGVSDCIDGFIVAESDGSLIGSVAIERHGEFALLRSAAVSHDYRGKGIGRELVDAIIARAESEGVKAIYLLTTTAESYFPGFGFTIVDRSLVPGELAASREFQDACPSSATVMRKKLSA
jgi:amino-acid N-acetyltransferase